MICPACQAENIEGSLTCFACGRPLAASAPQRIIQQGSILASRYEVLAALGRGGMGVVYKAHDQTLEEVVAIKVLRPEVAASPDIAKRFRSEIKLARKVTHRNVCRIHEYGIDGDLHYISMELCGGRDLKQVIRRRGALSPGEALDIAIQVCQGLQAIHEAGIIHRDLKTSNLMLDHAGGIKLMDFGIAKQALTDGLADATRTGQIIGTPEYMSPEQARGERLDGRTDVYSLGIVLYELFTGDVPFRGDTPIATILKHIQEPPRLELPVFDALPTGVVPAIRKALAKERDDRFASAREMEAALRALLPAVTAKSLPAGAEPTLDEARPDGAASATRAVAAPTSVAAARVAKAAVVPSRSVPLSGTPPAGLTPSPGTPLFHEPKLPLASPYATPPPTARQSGSSSPRPAAPVPQSAAARKAASGATPPVERPPAPGRIPAVSARQLALVLGVLFLAMAASAATAWLVWARLAGSNTRAVVTETASPGPTSASMRSEVTPEAASPESAPSAEAEVRESPRPLAERPLPARRPSAEPTPALVRRGPSPAPLQSAPSDTAAGTTAPPVSASAPPVVALPSASANAAPEPVPTPAAQTTGTLQLLIRPWAEVFIDGQSVGTTPMKPLALAAGIHTVRLSHPDYKPVQRRATIRLGEVTKLAIDLTEEAVPIKKD